MHKQKSRNLTRIVAKYKASHGYKNPHDKGVDCQTRHRGIIICAGLAWLRHTPIGGSAGLAMSRAEEIKRLGEFVHDGSRVGKCLLSLGVGGKIWAI